MSDRRLGGSHRRGRADPRARTSVLLNARWHDLGGASQRRCPGCDALILAGPDAVHDGGELYHRDCAPHVRP